MGENHRTAVIPVTAYNFTPVKRFGKRADEIKINEYNLFLDFTVSPPEEDVGFKLWEGFCASKRHSYLIAEGQIKEEVKQRELLKKAKALGKTPEEVLQGFQGEAIGHKGHYDYSFGYPEKVYGFFRVEDEIK